LSEGSVLGSKKGLDWISYLSSDLSSIYGFKLGVKPCLRNGFWFELGAQT